MLLGAQLCTIYRLQLFKGDEKHLIRPPLRQLPVAGYVVEPIAVYEMTLGEELQKVAPGARVVAQKGGHSVVVEVGDGIVLGIANHVDDLPGRESYE